VQEVQHYFGFVLPFHLIHLFIFVESIKDYCSSAY